MARSGSPLGGTTSLVTILIGSLLVGAVAWYCRFTIIKAVAGNNQDPGGYVQTDADHPSQKEIQNNQRQSTVNGDFLPTASGEIVRHRHYTLSYVERHEQAEWTAYKMDRKMLNVPNLGRNDNFTPDYDVKTRSAFHRDYSNSGYTRGHMVPAGDMAFDEDAMRESFFMSNMSPQLREYNNGVWKELEENIRDWTYKANELYIMTGPILTNPIKTIGKENKITVPNAFYKVLYDPAHHKGIGFIIPHARSEARLETYMVPIDKVEQMTGIDFFYQLLADQKEEAMESTFDPSLWHVSDKRYQLRVDKWNWE
jgi:endonuclease G, mitochondrial